MTRSTRILTGAVLGLALASGVAAPALAASGSPQRPAGDVVPLVSSVNGGDNGWGNCGHNSSGGVPPTDPTAGGNGGYKPGDCAEPLPTDPTLPTDPIAS